MPARQAIFAVTNVHPEPLFFRKAEIQYDDWRRGRLRPNDARMRRIAMTAPLWVLAVTVGLPFGIYTAVVGMLVGGRGRTEALITGVIAMVLVGGTVAAATHRQRSLVRRATGDLPKDELLATVVAAERGPIPADPELRARALAVSARRLAVLDRPLPRIFAVTTVALGVGAAVLGATSGIGWASLLPLVTAGTVGFGMVFQVRHLRQRVRLLSADRDTEVS